MCIALHGDHSWKVTHEHHVIFGTANRKLSEKYGLKVYLCLAHHEEGAEAVHKNAELSSMLKVQAQRAFSIRFPDLDWMKIFGKNYDTEPLEKAQEGKKEAGFILLDIDIGKIDW